MKVKQMNGSACYRCSVSMTAHRRVKKDNVVYIICPPVQGRPLIETLPEDCPEYFGNGGHPSEG